ncbi:MAG: hypothetical protein IPG78_17475 [Ignavibacteria bacterium]|nr:hypothetical protein [Ignavibacteria bacterium]
MKNDSAKISLSKELKRKAIHLSSSLIPVSYYFIERKTLLIILTTAFAAMVIIDILRMRSGFVRKVYGKFLGDILRPHENKSERIYFTGGTYIVLAFLLCILIFERNIAILSMLIIVFCDSAAAIAGKVFGKHHIGNKTIEGSISFFLTGVILFFVVIKPENFVLIISGVFSLFLITVFELIPVKIDDNLSIPLIFGILFSLLTKTDFLI